MSCRGFSKHSISTVILACRSALLPYYIGAEWGGIYNISISLKGKINAVNLHHENSLLIWKEEILSIVNALSKIIIPRFVYDTYVSNLNMTFMLNYLTWDFFFSKSVLMNCNILTSSLSGQVIWKNLIIRNSPKNNTHINILYLFSR